MKQHFLSNLRNYILSITTKFPDKRRRRSCRLASEQLETRHMLSAVVELVADLNQNPNGLDPGLYDHTELNGVAYFQLTTFEDGRELWKSDGTSSGTVRLTDIRPGSTNSWISKLMAVNNHVYFNVVGDSGRLEIWRTDGTPEGTNRFDVPPSSPEPLAVIGNNLYFRGRAFGNDEQVWVTDGTTSGTRLVVDLASFSNAGQIQHAIVSDGTLFFVSNDEADTGRLWATSGTTESTVLLLESPQPFVIFGASSHEGRLFFALDDGEHGSELWTSDGTADGTILVKDLNPGSGSSITSGLRSAGDSLFFFAWDIPGDNVWLWSSDGTDAGTMKLKTVNPATYMSAEFGGVFYYLNGEHLWKSDGTVDGTVRVFSDVSEPQFNGVENLNGRMFLFAFDPEHGAEVWVSNGTQSGTHLVRDINPGSGNSTLFPTFMTAGEYAIWVADDGVHGAELWASDGTTDGTRMLSDIETGTAGSFPRYLTEVAGDLFAHATYAATFYSRVDLFRFPADGALPVKLNGFFSYGRLQNADGKLFLENFDQTHGYEIWTSDGSTAQLLFDVAPGVETGGRLPLFSFNGEWYFFATGPQSGLWKTDGTGTGTSLVRRFSVENSTLPEVTNVNGKMYFIEGDNEQGFQLWKTDGTSGGTQIVAVALPYQAPSFPRMLRGISNSVHYVSGGNLYVVDTVTGMISDVNELPSGERLSVHEALEFDEELFFIADLRSQGIRSLWRATNAGADLHEIKSFSRDSNPSFLTRIDDGLIFVTDESLWRLDFANSEPRLLFNFGDNVDGRLTFTNWSRIENKVFFTIIDPRNGESQIWVTDGTADGTVRIQPQFASPLRMVGQGFVKYGNGIAFSAATRETGTELFRIDTTIDVPAPTDIVAETTVVATNVEWADVRGAIQYDIWVQSLNNPAMPVVKKRVNEPQYHASDDLSDGAYRIWVRSYPVLGEPSAWSSPTVFVVGNDPVMHAMPAQSLEDQPTFRWTGPQDVVSYELWLTNRDAKTRPIYEAGLTATSFAVTEPLEPARYAVWVRGTRADNTKTNWSELTEFEVLAPAIGLTSGMGDWRISRPRFAWPAVHGATGYDVRVQMTDGSTIYSVNNVAGLSHTVTLNLPAGKFTVFVRALKGARPFSAWGGGDAIWLKLPPTGLRSTATGIAWNAVPFAGSYTFELRSSNGNLVVPVTTQAGTTFDPATPLVPGQYSLRVFSNFANSSSNWSPVASFELFHPAVSITSSDAATADATPVVTWSAAANASSYEILVTRSDSSVPVYNRTGITGRSHRIDTPLLNGVNLIQVRAHFSDGSRSSWSSTQQLLIGPAPVLTFASGRLSWNAVNQATHYELWINFLGTPVQQKIVYEPVYVGTTYALPSTLPRARYQVWLRAIRAESGQLFGGSWASLIIDAV